MYSSGAPKDASPISCNNKPLFFHLFIANILPTMLHLISHVLNITIIYYHTKCVYNTFPYCSTIFLVEILWKLTKGVIKVLVWWPLLRTKRARDKPRCSRRETWGPWPWRLTWGRPDQLLGHTSQRCTNFSSSSQSRSAVAGWWCQPQPLPQGI